MLSHLIFFRIQQTEKDFVVKKELHLDKFFALSLFICNNCQPFKVLINLCKLMSKFKTVLTHCSTFSLPAVYKQYLAGFSIKLSRKKKKKKKNLSSRKLFQKISPDQWNPCHQLFDGVQSLL
jgi:hypothetical protein